MSSTIIVDYGMGNLRSVQKAFEKAGEAAVISSNPSEISAAQRVVLPGVGAFRDAAAALRNHDLVNVIKDHIAADRPFLGICLGLQLLLDVSYEDGEYEGLGIIPGSVTRFVLPDEFKIPHMGWNQLMPGAQVKSCPLFEHLPSTSWFYFVHSYHVVPNDESWVAARTDYGAPFVSAVCKGRVMATQFHPEKSQSAGLQLLKNFLSVPVAATVS
ncbi:MAG: imidazole glycerol phosphate synthase subunit HisH [Planctomycetaceae bacterium]|nr:imidazole glycerol phosphate synthase subunit HisH [Planctomycetaceae bacterium]